MDSYGLMSQRPGFLPPAKLAFRTMVTHGRIPPAYHGGVIPISGTRLAAATSIEEVKQAKATAIAGKLEEGGNLIVAGGKALASSLDRIYAQYQNSATQNRLLGALRAAYNVLKATDPFLSFIMGNVDNQALVKLQSAERIGLQWMTSLKDNWYGEGTQGPNLHEGLAVVNNELALEVEATFDSVQQSTASISTLARQVEQLPEEILSRGLEYYFSSMKSSSAELWFDISSIFSFVKAALDAVGVASHDMATFLNQVFPKTKQGSAPASAFPSVGTLLLVGGGLLTLYLVLK